LLSEAAGVASVGARNGNDDRAATAGSGERDRPAETQEIKEDNQSALKVHIMT
jgi:hypothetical protein